MKSPLQVAIEQAPNARVIQLGSLVVPDNEFPLLASALARNSIRVMDLHEATVSISRLAEALKHKKVLPYVQKANLFADITDPRELVNALQEAPTRAADTVNTARAKMNAGYLILIFNEDQFQEFYNSVQKTWEKDRNDFSAFAFSCASALYGLSGLVATEEFGLAKNYDFAAYFMQAAIYGPLFGALHGISPFNYKKILAGIANIQIVCAATYLTSQLIADPKARIATYAVLAIPYIIASSKCLSSESLELPGLT